MKETVDKILKEEEAARKSIEQARLQAQELVRKAQAESDRLVEESLAQAQTAAENVRLEADKGFVWEKDKELKLTLEDITAKKLQKNDDIPALSRKIFQGLIRIKG